VTFGNTNGYGDSFAFDDFTIGTIDQVKPPTTNVPEFPTVAIPVAAVLGLIFVFGRRKE